MNLEMESILSTRKRFDQTLFQAFDQKSKKKAKAILKKAGYKAQDSAKKTDVDLFVEDEQGVKFYVEVEVKTLWKSAEFPYETIQFLERKEKYAKLDKPTIFMMFNEDLSNYLTVLSKDLIKSPKKMVRNRYVRFGEEFFQVPVKKANFNKLPKGY